MMDQFIYALYSQNNNFIDLTLRMIDTPIRKKNRNYPKDFTPPPGYLTTNSNSNTNQPRTPIQIPTQTPRTRISHIRIQSLNRSTQLTPDNNNSNINHESTRNVIITINPQQAGKIISNDGEKQEPLINMHFGRKGPYINPELLSRPRIQEKQDQELAEDNDSGLQDSTPGTIRKNVGVQRPLDQEQPSYVAVPSKQVFSTRKMESNENIFYQSVKSQYTSFNNLKYKKLPSFLKPGLSQPQGSFKLSKKFSHNPSESHLQTPKSQSQQKEKQQLLQFGSLLQQKQIDKLKAHINQIAYQKSKNKQKLNQTNQTQADAELDGYKYQTGKRRKRPQSNFVDGVGGGMGNYYGELGQDQYERRQRTGGQIQYYNHNRPQQYHNLPKSRTNSTPKPSPLGRKITISYKKTSLSQLKQIYNTITRSPHNIQLQVSVPHVLMSMCLDRNADKSELYASSAQILQTLGIPVQNLTVKRYSNCIQILSRNICILWHYEGRVYLGSWQIKYLDQGFKHGLGLEWVPNKYVYYGQFAENKRNGLGVMRMRDETYVGEWVAGSRGDQGFVVNRNGEVTVSTGGIGGNCRNGGSRGFQADPFQ